MKRRKPPLIVPMLVRLTASSLVGALLFPQPGASAPARTNAPSPAAEIDALDGAMPSSFEFYIDDPCAGMWRVEDANGKTLITMTVFRYRGLPLVHLDWTEVGPMNMRYERLDPRSVRVSAGSSNVVLRCAGVRGVLELTIDGATSPLILSARSD